MTAPATLQHPEFVFPAPPAGAAAAAVERLTRGWYRLQANELAGAEKEFAGLVGPAPGFAPARAGLGYVELARKRFAAAVTHFEAASPPGAPYPPALVGRGLAELAAGREEPALASLEAALAADPSIPDLAERVATLRVRVVQDWIGRAERRGRRAVGRGRAAYRLAIGASPEAAFLYRDLALMERRAGREETALELSRAALIHDPDDVKAHVLVGDVLAERGEFDEVLAAYRRAAAIEPSAALDAAMAGVRERAREAALPAPYRNITRSPQATRADLAALLGVRLAPALARAGQQQVVVTDVRGHWAQPWIERVARAGAMEVYPNYTFQPGAALRRADLADAVSRTLALLAPPGTVARWDATEVPVSDVPPTHLAFPAVRRAIASGVLRLDDGAFNPLAPVTGVEAIETATRLSAMASGPR
ncbi:MAG: S-layer homology domain-containing protein [Vicinamibacterales bacterium]